MNPYEALPGPLTKDEERKLLAGDKVSNLEIRDRLLVHSLKDAIKYASACCRGLLPSDELMSLCTIALLKAIENYDPNHASHLGLISFAKAYIRGQLQKAWRDRNPVAYGHEIPDRLADESLEAAAEEEFEDPAFDRIHAHERWVWVKPHFNKLSETEQRVLILLFESRFTLAEVGRMLDCTRENVRVTKLRALKKIRNGLYRDKLLYES